MKTSLITIVSRPDHLLDRQAELVTESTVRPDEWVVVSLGFDAEPAGSPVPVTARQISSTSPRAIAAAYAEAVRLSVGARLVFMDGGCLPLTDVFAAFDSAFSSNDALWMARTSNISSGDSTPEDTIDRLRLLHRGDTRGAPVVVSDYKQFRSDCFAISRVNYRAIGGFDPAFAGWDTEDTDFALAAKQVNVSLGVVDVDVVTRNSSLPNDPEHVPILLRAARQFRSKWGFWPSRHALRSLAVNGFIEFNAARDHLRLLRLPTAAELERLFKSPTTTR